MEAGNIVKVNPRPSLADGLAVPVVGSNTFAIAKKNVDSVITVRCVHGQSIGYLWGIYNYYCMCTCIANYLIDVLQVIYTHTVMNVVSKPFLQLVEVLPGILSTGT